MRIVLNDYNGKPSMIFDDLEMAAKTAAGATYADGELERLRETCENLAAMIGRLLAVVPLANDELARVLGHRFEIAKDGR